MKPQAQGRAETRSETLFRFTQRMLHETRTTMETFSMSVVAAYHEMVVAEAREVEFKTDGDFYRCVATNAQKLRRYMDAETNVRLPADLEEAWVAGLTEPYRSECIAALAGRYGLLAVHKPTGDGAMDVRSIAALPKEMGEALEALAPMLENGKFGPEDAHYAHAAIKQLEDLCAIATGMIFRIKQAISLKAVS